MEVYCKHFCKFLGFIAIAFCDFMEVIAVAFHEVADTSQALFARSREGEHGSSREWSFTSVLTLSRQRKKERDFRVILRVS